MTIWIFLVLLVIACVILGFFVLIQNSKGGGLTGNVAGFSNQIMGVKQTTDVLEKGTWIFAVVIALLCLTSAYFIPHQTTIRQSNGVLNNVGNGPVQQQAPAQTPPGTPAPASK